MIVRHGTLWAIAVLVLLVSVSFSESVKLRKPRKRTMMKTPYQQSRLGPVIIKVMHKYNDDSLARGASGGCTNGKCRNVHDKFLNVNEAISEEDDFLSDKESLRYVVHPEKYEHFVLRKNTGHANRYKRDSELYSSNASDRTEVDCGNDASKVSENENKGNIMRIPLYGGTDRNKMELSKLLSEASKIWENENGNLTRVPLYKIDKNKRDLSKLSSEASKIWENENNGNLMRISLYNRIDRNKRDLSKRLSETNEVSENKNKGNLTRVPLYRIDRNKRNLSKLLNEANNVSKNENTGNLTRVPLHRIDRNKRNLSKLLNEANNVSKNENTENLTRVPLHRIDRNKRNLSKLLNEANNVSKNENTGNLTRVPLHRIDRNKRDLSKLLNEVSNVSKNENTGNLTRVPLYRINKNKRDLSKLLNEASNVSKNENTGNLTRVPLYRIDRNKRDFSKHLSQANKVSENENKVNFTRVPLYRIDYNTRDLTKVSSESSRTGRNLTGDYFSRRNDDYYAERKAIMERYYARQREINEQYANRTSVIPRLEHNVSQPRLATSNATLFNLGRVYPSKDSTARDSTTFRHPSTKIDPIYSNESRYNKIPTELDSRRNTAPDLGFKPDADLSQTRSSDNNERNALDYFVTPTPCTNLSSSGTLAPKTRPKQAKNCTSETGLGDCGHNSTDNANIEGNPWGKCEGKIVYQHNLLLGLTGPSNLDALFEVIIQGPICITCVEALRYNETRATVTLESGGRGHEYAKLRLQGYENEGFSYIVKVWGVNKTGQVCDNVD